MFVRLSSSIPINKIGDNIYASSKRPVVYTLLNDIVYEISLKTREHKEIHRINDGRPCNLACDHDDNIFISLSFFSHPAYIMRLSPPDSMGDLWKCDMFTSFDERPIPKTLQCSHYGFTKAWYKWLGDSAEKGYSYIENHILHYYGGHQWKRYTLMGNTTAVTPYWISPYNSEIIFCCNADHPHSTQLWVTRGDRAFLLWERVRDEPLWITYSPVTNSIYGLSTNASRTEQYISIYQFEVPTLFHLCSLVINRDVNLFNKVIPCLQEQVELSKTQREQNLMALSRF